MVIVGSVSIAMRVFGKLKYQLSDGMGPWTEGTGVDGPLAVGDRGVTILLIVG